MYLGDLISFYYAILFHFAAPFAPMMLGSTSFLFTAVLFAYCKPRDVQVRPKN